MTALGNGMSNNATDMYVVTKNTASTWLKIQKNKSPLEKSCTNSEKKIIPTSEYEEIEEAFLQWFLTKKCQTIAINRV